MKLVNKPISEIKPYIRNPRINDKAVDALCDIIPRVGFNVPILVDKAGVIVKGHSRYAAAIRLGMAEVPCIISENDEETNKLDRIADNRINELSKWELEGLNYELDSLTLNFDILDFDYTPVDMEYEDFLYEDKPTTAPVEQILSKPVNITTQERIDAAEEKLSKPTAPKQYVKFVCEKCGHVMFADGNNLWTP